MFLGEYVHSIDDKNRLAVPARFRQDLAEGLYLTKGVDRCLYALTPDGWNRLAERIAALPSMQASARQLQRHFFAGAVHVTPDKLGRILIPRACASTPSSMARSSSPASTAGSSSGAGTPGTPSRRGSTSRQRRWPSR